MTDAELLAINQRIQRAGAANCWTGTLGSLAADARRLVKHIQETRMSDEHPPRIEVTCNTCRGIVGLLATCPDCMGKGTKWKINSPSEPWKYRDEDPPCFRIEFDEDEYEQKSAATRAAVSAIRDQAEYPVDHILRGERELRHYTGDEMESSEAMILTEDDAADVAEETARAAQIGDGRVFPEPETAGPPVDQSTPGKWVNKGQAPGELPGWDRYEFVPDTSGTTAKFGTGAVRSDTVEAFRYDLVSPIGLREVARTCAEGAAKYGDWNWEKGMPVHDLLNHAIAHLYQFLSGDRNEPHLGHAAWNVLAAIHSHELWPHLNEGNLRKPGCCHPSAPPAAGGG